MIRLALVLFHAAALLLAATAPAYAGPLIAGVAAFMATPIGSLIVGIGSMLINNVVKGLFGSKQAQRTNGTQLNVRLGGDGPFSFPLGPSATAGTKFYHGSWGKPGEAPNAYFVEAFAASDLPIAGWKGFWVNDQRAVFGAYDATLGYPVLDFRRNGVDHVWIKHYRGVQLSPDPYLRDKFGTHPVYPYTEDMVGRGVAYFIVTTRRPGPDDQDLLSSPARVLAEPDSILQYDLRKDSTVGGVGGHRWGDYSTYEPSSNLMVQAYNVARGISYNGEWVFGGQNWPAFRLPAASWMAAMNACDLAISLKEGGTEPQFHGGGMVDVSEIDAASVLNELMKSASAKIAEGGGIYKIRVGAPGIPVMHFTDEDIVVTREHGWSPFKGIGETFNTVNWSYSEPGERWANKPGPQYRDAALIAADRGRTLPMPFDLPWTQSNTTGQRLVQAALKNSRRFDTHALYLPPIAWLLEALDTVSWTSEAAGYIAKEFEVDEIGGGSDLIQFASIRENDPEDYDWVPGTDQRPYAVAPMATIRPAPQEVSSPSVAPVPGTLAYDVFWSAASVAVDVQFVRVSHRLPDDDDARFTVLIPKPDLLTGSARVPVGLDLSNTLIEVQLEYIPYSGRLTIASAWMPVTIANVRIGPDDLTDELKEAFEDIQDFMDEDLPSIRDELNNIQAQLADIAGAGDYDIASAYDAGDLVKFEGGLYRALQAVPAGTDPTHTDYWEKIGDYASLGEAVAALAALINDVETDLEATNQKVISNTRTTRRQSNALMAAAMLNSEQGANQTIENTDQLAATAVVSETVRTEVSRIDGTTTALSEKIDVVQAKVETDVAEAIEAVTTQVENVDGRVTAQAAAVNALRAVIGEGSAEVLMKGEAVAAPSGFVARWALRLQVVDGTGVPIAATFFVDVRSNGTSRIGFAADNIVFFLADGTPIALFDENGVQRSANDTVRINWRSGAFRLLSAP